MNITLQLILLSLATWRVSSLLAREDGPFDIFVKLRHYMGVAYNDASEPYGTNWFSKGIICLRCLSLYIAAVASLTVAQDALQWVVYTLALSTLTILIDEWVS